MAHSHQGHREHSKSRSRAGHILKSGGDAHPHAAKDKGMIPHSMRTTHDSQPTTVHGYARGGRIDKYARGGKADKKHHTQVNIAVVAPHRGEESGAAGAPGGAPVPPRPPMAGPAMPPGLPPGIGGPPGLPPGMPPPGAMPPGGPRPPMARGGRTVSQMHPLAQSHPAKRHAVDGVKHPPNVGHRGAVKPGGGLFNKYASGGPTKPVKFDGHTAQKGGGDSGVGRRNKPKMYGGSKPHPKI